MRKLWNLLLVLFICSSALLFHGCEKKSKQEDPTPKYGPLTVRENVLVIDSINHHLDTTSTLLDAGIYKFTNSGTSIQVSVGSIIVGEQGEGFLRRVTSISSQGNQSILQTVQASLDEVFSEGLITLQATTDSLIEGRLASTGFEYDFGSYLIAQSGAISLRLLSGKVSLNPNWVIKTGFKPDGVIEAEVAARGSNVIGNLVFNVTASQATKLTNQKTTLKKYHKYYTFYVPAVIAGIPIRIPIKVRMNLNLDLQYSADVNAAITRNVTFTADNTFDLGVRYANHQWEGIYNLNTNNNLILGPRNGNADALVQLAIIPKLTFLFYGMAGPYASIGLHEEIKGGITSPTLDWDIQFDAWLRFIAGTTGKVFGKELPDFSNTWETDKLTFKTPYRIERVSGDNQLGPENQALPNPIKVRVTDSKGDPQSGVPVYFTPLNGNHGNVSPASILTDANGYAQAIWTLGLKNTTTQTLNVTAKTSSGQNIADSPIEFKAAIGLNCMAANSPEIQLLTSGSTKLWKMVYYSLEEFGVPVVLCSSINGQAPKMTFTLSGSFSIDNHNIDPSTCASIIPITPGLPRSYCMTGPNQIRLLADNGAPYEVDVNITELTSTSLKIRYVSGNDPNTYFVNHFIPN